MVWVQRSSRADDSRRNLYDFFADGRWDRITVLLKADEIALDRVFNVGDSLIACPSLRDTTGQGRTLGDVHSILVLLDDNSVTHIPMIVPLHVEVNPRPLDQRPRLRGVSAEAACAPCPASGAAKRGGADGFFVCPFFPGAAMGIRASRST
jgi:hypothetical protein